MNRLWKVLSWIGVTIVLLVILFFCYGLATDCPNTAGYVPCSEVN